MTDIFLTGTFRNDWNKEFNLKLIKLLEERGYSVYAPQRDSEQKGGRKKIFEQNVKGIDNSKIVIAIGAKTQSANWGFEIGYAFKTGKPVIILTDSEHPVELMPEGAAAKIIIPEDIESFGSYFEGLANSIKSLI